MALKVRELLQPAAKERQREAGGDRKSEAVRSFSADLREAIKEPAKAPSPPIISEERKTTAQAAKVVGASPRAVEQAARVERSAPDLLPQAQAGTMALDKAHRERLLRKRRQAMARLRQVVEVPGGS
jgi:hypothetical protein